MSSRDADTYDESHLYEKLVDVISASNNNDTWTLYILDKKIHPTNTTITKSTIPIKKSSATRGGVYYTQKQAYKIACFIPTSIPDHNGNNSQDITSSLTSTMLGPNTDFKPIKIIVSIHNNQYTITAHLFNYIQTKDGNTIQLSLVANHITESSLPNTS